MSALHSIVIVGGGIVGLATARALQERLGRPVVVLEAEPELGRHQTGRNSGVIHSGLYYKPGSYKARNCAEGREAMYRFCQEHGIPHERCGKVVVATAEREIPALDELERRGRANGLVQLRRLGPAEIKDYEPHATGVAGLLVGDTGIVDYKAVLRKLAELVQQGGGDIRCNARLLSVRRSGSEQVLETTAGPVSCRYLVNCGGLQCDRIARLCGVEPGLQIIPFRGDYYQLVPSRQHLVRNLIYPVPDPRFPFLGVHFTRTIAGGVEAGPNAVLSFQRDGYSRWSFSFRDSLQMLTYRGFWKMAAKYWRTGLEEMYRSISQRAFYLALQRLIPELQREDIVPGGCGIRAQAVEPDGKLVDDFRILAHEGNIHVLNAPSPAATASLSIGRTIAELAIEHLERGER